METILVKWENERTIRRKNKSEKFEIKIRRFQKYERERTSQSIMIKVLQL